MTPEAAARALAIEVKETYARTKNQMNSRLPRAANALRNAEIEVLSGNPSPSPPGSPPGRRSGHLRTSWTIYHSGGAAGIFGIKSGAHYAGYLEDGTSKMAARPFADKIRETAMPEIIAIFSDMGG